MAAVRFEQDPEAPPGAGMFELDTGQSIYAHDPDLAQSLSQPSPYQIDPELLASVQPGDDQRLALAPKFQTTDQRFAAGGAAPGLDQQLNTMSDMAPAPSPPPPAPPPQQAQPAPQAPPGEQPTEFDTNVANYVQALARRRSGPTPEAWIPKTRAETVETEGAPYSDEDAALRIKANQDVMAAKGATAEMLRDRAINNMAAEKAAQPALMQRAAEAQKQLDAQHSAYMADRTALQQAIDTSNNSAPSQSAWFASKNTLAQIIMVLGQAFGAYAAIKSKTGRNYFQETINGMMESDIAAQKDQAKRGIDNAYRRLELRYKDRDQAEAALRIAQSNVLSNVQSMQASANQAQDVQAAHQEMLAQNQANLVTQEQKFQNAAYGKHTVKMDVAHRPASGGGGPDIAAIAKQLKAAGLTDEQVRTAIFGQGGAPDKDIQEQVRDLSTKAAPLVKAQADMEAARTLIQKYKGKEDVPGMGYGADIAAAVPFGVGQRVFSNEEARANRGVVNRFAISYRHAATGAGGTSKEDQRIIDAILGSKTVAEFAAAVDEADASLAKQRQSYEAGYDPRAVALWRRRGGYQPNELPAVTKQVGK